MQKLGRLPLLPIALPAALLCVAGCSWLARYDRALTSNTWVREELPSRGEISPAADVQTAIPPRAGFIADSTALSPESERAGFTVPPGFEVQLVASEPDIHKPMQLAFDERGRLLVSASTEYPLGAKNGDAPTDRVMLLEIDGETGAATKVSTLAEGFNICSGVEALPGGRVILGHAPDILLLTDTDGDGAADAREVLYTGFARDDTHELPNSFTWGLDGWLYGLQGHVNESNVRNKAGEVTAIHYGNVYRMRPDGSEIEVWARGMSNPWGLTFSLQQELYASDCESRPLWQIVGGLPYQGFRQSEDPLGFAPVVTEDAHGASGFAGLVSYTADAFPEEYRDCLFLGNPITGRIHRDRPGSAGSTHPMIRQPDFLVSQDPWFRPVDIELGPEGALYIADWYNPIIAHVEVALDHPRRDKTRGRIWRIVYRGTAQAPAHREAARQFEGPMARDWSAASRDDLLDGLSQRNAWVRRMAVAQLMYRFPGQWVRRCREIILHPQASSTNRIEALALLHRGDELSLRHSEALMQDPDPWMRREVVRLLAHWPKQDTLTRDRLGELLIARLHDPSPFVVREAAMALRGVATPASFEALLDRAASVPEEDTLLRYAIRYAAREHLRDDRTLGAVTLTASASRHREELLDLLLATPTPAAASATGDRLDRGEIPEGKLRNAAESIFSYGDAPLIERAIQDSDALATAHAAAYASSLFKHEDRVRDLGVDPVPVLQKWCGRLADATDPESQTLALEIAAKHGFAEAKALSLDVIGAPSASFQARELAAKLLLALDYPTAVPLVLAVISDTAQPVPLRRLLAREAGRHIDRAEHFPAFVEALAGAPREVYDGAVESLSTRKPGVLLLLDAVEAGSISAGHINNHVTRLRIEGIHRDPELNARYAALVQQAFNPEEEGVTLALAVRLRDTYAQAPLRDVPRGQRVFEENCMICHRMGGLGALIGPNLDGARNRGVERLLQDIMVPSQDIDPAFLTTSITLDGGDFADGLVVEENESQVVLANSLGQRRAVSKSGIVERRTLPLSPMPTGFATNLAGEDVLDLLGFLLNPPAKMQPLTARGQSLSQH